MPIAPFIPLIASGINAATQLLTNNANVKAQKAINQQSLDYQTGWANQQRQWALQDWQMQNEYNTPAAQRQRMIEGGMSPALMYGSGSTNQPSATVRSTPSPQWNPKAPEYNLNSQSTISTYLGVKMQQAQLEQMQIQNDLLRAKLPNVNSSTQLNYDKSALTQSQNAQLQSWLKGLETYNALPVSQSEVDSGQYTSTDTKRDYQSEKMWSELKNKWQDYSNKFNSNDRAQVLNAKNVEQIVAKISLMAQQQATSAQQAEQIKANTDLLIKSGVLKQINIDGQQMMNSRFDTPILKVLLGLLNRADILR